MFSNTTLLTGLPRSGTTLVCALLNEFPDTLALAEPISLEHHGDRHRAVHEIGVFIKEARRQALETGKVRSCHVNGVIPDNWAEPPSTQSRLRKVHASHGLIEVNKPLTEHFHLVIKHPAEFSALADLLVDQYPLIALVRHPLAVMAAWQTVDMPVHNGHMPTAEAFSPDLSNALAATPNRLQRQVTLLGWLLNVYSQLPPERVLRYEDLVTAPRKLLDKLSPNARDPKGNIVNHSLESRYSGVDLSSLARELISIQILAEKFYPDFVASLTPWLN